MDAKRPFKSSHRSTSDALYDAQRLAFGPIAFQAARVLRDTGLLKALDRRGPRAAADELAREASLSLYATTVLLESGLGVGLVSLSDDDRWALTKSGWLVENDPMTRANMDFVHEVCYRPMFFFEQAIKEGRPSGLGEIGEGETVYEALAQLAPSVREAWLRFDHFYSDGAFDAAIDAVLATSPRSIVDVGANTGRFAQVILARDPELTIHLADLPGQLAAAKTELSRAGLLERARMHPVDMRKPDATLPQDVDAVWMSQFLVCFSLEQIETIFAKARAALAPGGSVWILDTFWDRQRHDVAAFCLVQSSPYFTAVASGVGKMYRAEDIQGAAERAGLRLVGSTDGLGLSHSLLRFGVR